MSAIALDATVRLLLVDDHEVVRAGLRTLLQSVVSIEVVGEATSAAEALEQSRRLRPRVVLMDLRLPDGSGVDACREILSADTGSTVLFLTSYADEDAIMATILAGAAGYLLKDIDSSGLVRAIEDAAHGRRVAESAAVKRVRERVQTFAHGKAPRDGLDALSPQETKVLALVVQGRTNKEIGAALGLSDKTVKNYLSNVFQKLAVRRRAEAAAVYAERRRQNAV